MNRKILIPALALAIALLSGCAASGGGSAGEARVFGQNILLTRTASDEEVFAAILEEAGGKLVMDEAVSLAGLHGNQEEGWLLVHYSVVDGETRPLWFHAWTGESWSEAIDVSEEEYGWLPVSAPETAGTQAAGPSD